MGYRASILTVFRKIFLYFLHSRRCMTITIISHYFHPLSQTKRLLKLKANIVWESALKLLPHTLCFQVVQKKSSERIYHIKLTSAFLDTTHLTTYGEKDRDTISLLPLTIIVTKLVMTSSFKSFVDDSSMFLSLIQLNSFLCFFKFLDLGSKEDDDQSCLMITLQTSCSKFKCNVEGVNMQSI